MVYAVMALPRAENGAFVVPIGLKGGLALGSRTSFILKLRLALRRSPINGVSREVPPAGVEKAQPGPLA